MTLSIPMTPAEFEELAQRIRPELHRYATRMTGSVIDGEDVVQEALVKAYSSLSLLTHNTNIRGWLFRITHNKAIDHFRRYGDEPLELLDEYPMTEEADQPLEEKELATFALSMFLKLAPRQRSCVIFKDVMGYSLAEISELLDASVPEIKATLHRGRSRLRELAQHPDSTSTSLDMHEQERLALYVERFNARDYDALRAMLTDDVHLDLVGRSKWNGIGEVGGRYFFNYGKFDFWRFKVGTVERHPAILAYDSREESLRPAYFILLTWENERVKIIRDYVFALHVIREAEVTVG